MTLPAPKAAAIVEPLIVSSAVSAVRQLRPSMRAGEAASKCSSDPLVLCPTCTRCWPCPGVVTGVETV